MVFKKKIVITCILAALIGLSASAENKIKKEKLEIVFLMGQANSEGREYTPKGPPEKTGELSYCWGMTLPQLERVLVDPGKYHPETILNKATRSQGWFGRLQRSEKSGIRRITRRVDQIHPQ